MNPTQAVVEERVAALEGGVAALLVRSGQAAETFAILNLAEAGDHIVSSPSLYGGTYNLFHYTLPKLGIEVTFVEDPDDLDAVARRRRARTPRRSSARRSATRRTTSSTSRASPTSRTRTASRSSSTTRSRRRTSSSPLEHGADIVVHSATKFLGGHGTAIGGVIVDGGTFDWAADTEKFPQYNQPDPSYHGLVYGRGRLGEPRVHHQGPRAAAARPRRGDLAVQRVAHRPGPRDAVAAHRAPRAERPEGRGVARGAATRSRSVNYAGLPSSPWYAARPEVRPEGRRRGARVRAQGRRRGRARSSSTRSSCSATSPTSATCARW